jgi:Mn2+/Fe2+ NRAMP family transporter
MKKWLSIVLGIMTATGGFLDAGAFATAGEAGATFGFGLIWAFLLATFAITMLVEMSGRFTAVSQKTYVDAVRENFGFRFYLLILASELIANCLMIAAEMGGVAIALSLFTGIDWRYLFPVAALLVWLLVWRASFQIIENLPSLIGLVTLSFLVGIALLGGPRADLLPTLWRPEMQSGELANYLYLAAAIFGAIISPYLLYFYSSGAREEKWTRRSLLTNRVTAVAGMSFGSISAIALVILSAMVLQPLHVGGNTLEEMGLTMAQPLGQIGVYLFATALFATCLGASLEVVLSMSYNISQGFGWEWGEEKKPVKAARFNLVLTVFILVAIVIGLLGVNPLQLALFGSAVTALLLPISLFPFVIIMNDRQYLKDKTNRRWSNIATIVILLLACVVAAISIPLEILSGG